MPGWRRPLDFSRHLLRFSGRVIKAFVANRGLLLAGGVGYNAVLSIIPFFALTVTGLSFVVDEQQILRVVALELDRLLPAHAAAVLQVLRGFLEAREVVGVVGFFALLIFSTIAFRMLEQAIEVIFAERAHAERRRAWVSLVLPYASLVLLGFALLLVTLLTIALDALGQRTLAVLGHELSLARASSLAVRTVSYLSVVLLFTLMYKVLPVVQVRWRLALPGGVAAATLWEVVGRMLAYYFTTLSLVTVIYGSLATLVVVMLGMEAVAAIVLLGAQVIAELQRSEAAGRPWYQAPDNQ